MLSVANIRALANEKISFCKEMKIPVAAVEYECNNLFGYALLIESGYTEEKLQAMLSELDKKLFTCERTFQKLLEKQDFSNANQYFKESKIAQLSTDCNSLKVVLNITPKSHER